MKLKESFYPVPELKSTWVRCRVNWISQQLGHPSKDKEAMATKVWSSPSSNDLNGKIKKTGGKFGLQFQTPGQSRICSWNS